MKKIAILLAAYNGEEWIEKQIKTILNQKDVCLDIFISLDLSTDNTLNIIKSLKEQNHNIILLPYGQKFGSAALNFFNLLLNVPVENYDYIALSDQDDIWHEKKLIRAINILEEQNGYGYSSNVIAFWENGKRKFIKKAFPQCKYDYLFEVSGPGCTFVIKNKLALNMIKFFSDKKERLFELKYHDWIIYAFARSNKYKWIIDDQALMEYRQHSNNQLGANVGLKAIIFRFKKILSGEVIDQVIKIISFLGIENNEFVSKWYKNKKINYLFLACSSRELRRSNRDKVLFFFFCIISFFRDINKSNKCLNNTQG